MTSVHFRGFRTLTVPQYKPTESAEERKDRENQIRINRATSSVFKKQLEAVGRACFVSCHSPTPATPAFTIATDTDAFELQALTNKPYSNYDELERNLKSAMEFIRAQTNDPRKALTAEDNAKLETILKGITELVAQGN